MALQKLEAASFAEKNQPASVAAVSLVVVACLSLSAPIFALNKHLQVQMSQLQVASSEHSLNNTETDMRSMYTDTSTNTRSYAGAPSMRSYTGTAPIYEITVDILSRYI